MHPHTRLAAFYFAYFGYLGAFTPYFSLYLKEIGLAATQIAIVVALPQLVKVFKSAKPQMSRSGVNPIIGKAISASDVFIASIALD